MSNLNKTMEAVAGIGGDTKKQVEAKLGAAASEAESYVNLLKGNLEALQKTYDNALRAIEVHSGDVKQARDMAKKYLDTIVGLKGNIDKAMAQLGNDWPEAKKIMQDELDKVNQSIRSIGSLGGQIKQFEIKI